MLMRPSLNATAPDTLYIRHAAIEISMPAVFGDGTFGDGIKRRSQIYPNSGHKLAENSNQSIGQSFTTFAQWQGDAGGVSGHASICGRRAENPLFPTLDRTFVCPASRWSGAVDPSLPVGIVVWNRPSGLLCLGGSMGLARRSADEARCCRNGSTRMARCLTPNAGFIRPICGTF